MILKLLKTEVYGNMQYYTNNISVAQTALHTWPKYPKSVALVPKRMYTKTVVAFAYVCYLYSI